VEIAELVLKYIEALVWPAVTVGLVWGLRSHIREAFTRMTRLETPAGAIEFETQARDVLNQAEEVTIADTLERMPPPPETPTPRPAGGGDGAPPPPLWPPPSGQGEPSPPPWTPYPAAEPEELSDPGPEDEADETYGSPTAASPAPQLPRQGPPPPLENPWALDPPPQPPAVEAPYWRAQLRDARTMVDVSPVGAVVTAWNALLGAMTDVLQLPEHPERVTAPQVLNAMRRAGLPPDAARVFTRLNVLRSRAVHQVDTVTPGAARDFIESCHHVAQLVGTSR
jgi:hypothetical protein